MRIRYALRVTLLLILVLSLLAACPGCLGDFGIKLPYEGYAPEVLDDGWEISDPQAEGFDPDEITDVYRRFHSEKLYPTIHSLLVVRNGKLVAEAYCRDRGERDMLHSIQSATKSITSLLTGIAIDKGFIQSVDQRVYDYIPKYFDSDIRKREITLHHVLTMETGLDFDNDDHTEKLYNSNGSSLEFVLHRPLIFTPGSDWYYGDGNPQLLSGIIQEVSGMSEEEFAIENLFTPLGIIHYRWDNHADGLTFGAFGLWLRPRDMAKIGRLMAQNGMWNMERIVSAEWIAESTRLQTSHQTYGYYWYPWESQDAYYAEGHGGQLIYVVPDKQIVVVITADSYSNSRALASRFGELFLGVMDAVVDE
ncbi:MAG: serine hydrolase [bacterium]|jgi:CubicO group peptidase (beta-lactamase class C family)